MEGRCGLCGRVTEIKYTMEDGVTCCVGCELSDKDMWRGLAQDRKKARARKRAAITNIAKRMKILDRIEMPNEGTCLLDGLVYYYAQKKVARIKGEKRYIQMSGVQDFFDYFLGYKEWLKTEIQNHPEKQIPENESKADRYKRIKITDPLRLAIFVIDLECWLYMEDAKNADGFLGAKMTNIPEFGEGQNACCFPKKFLNQNVKRIYASGFKVKVYDD